MNISRFFKLFLFFIVLGSLNAQVISIHEARTKSLGTQVTVRGIILNGDEMGTIRYMDDGTGGIAIFTTSGSTLLRGDSIEITGVLGHFNNLLQLSSGISYTVLASNRPLPQPIEFSSNLSGGFSKAYESRLIKIKTISSLQNISGTSCGSSATVFSGNRNYCINVNFNTPIRVSNPVNGAGDIIGKNVPTAPYSVTGIISMFNKGNFSGGTTSDPQYYDTTLSTGFQLLVRNYEDFQLPPKPNITADPRPVMDLISGFPKVSTDEVTLFFSTQNQGSTRLEYGTTQLMGTVTGDSLYKTYHEVKLTNLLPGTLYYMRATSTNPNGVSVSRISSFVTKSLSSGRISVYFTHQPDTSVATHSKAMMLDDLIDDTVTALINRAKNTLDMAIYNINPTNLSDFIKALNDAYTRGVRVRVVFDGSTANIGLNQLNPGIGIISRPVGQGIMHNKFIVIDANDSNPFVPIVWTGSTNLTRAQIVTDENHIIIIQDQSLAKAYVVEFEEMFGSSDSQPDPSKSKFGPDKSNQTPHDFIIGNKYIESFFSPSDQTTLQIIDACKSAEDDLYFMVMSFTRTDISSTIRNVCFDGVYAAGVIEDTGSAVAATVYNNLIPTGVLNGRLLIHNQSGIMHNKVGIIDPNNEGSDPTVIAGSHNWSSSAENDNDENTLIIHDADITNQYYQSFRALYEKLGKNLSPLANFSISSYFGNYNDSFLFRYTGSINPVTINWDMGDGKTINGVNSFYYSYANAGKYRVTLYCSDGTYSDSVIQSINLYSPTGIISDKKLPCLQVYPNPVSSRIINIISNDGLAEIKLYSIDGKLLLSKKINGSDIIHLSDNINPGIYILTYDGFSFIHPQYFKLLISSQK